MKLVWVVICYLLLLLSRDPVSNDAFLEQLTGSRKYLQTWPETKRPQACPCPFPPKIPNISKIISTSFYLCLTGVAEKLQKLTESPGSLDKSFLQKFWRKTLISS